jgi:hypothetical protein
MPDGIRCAHSILILFSKAHTKKCTDVEHIYMAALLLKHDRIKKKKIKIEKPVPDRVEEKKSVIYLTPIQNGAFYLCF